MKSRKQLDHECFEIAGSIQHPAIPDRTIDLADFCGHAPDHTGSHDFQADIRHAIEKLHAVGGGTLHIRHPEGALGWDKTTATCRVRGPIRLLSNIRLLLDPGLIVRFEFDPTAYLPDGQGVFRQYEGTALYSFCPLLYACGAENIAIEAAPGFGGPPLLRGDGEAWWNWTRNGQRRQAAEGRMPSYLFLKQEINNKRIPLNTRVFTDPENDYFRPDFLGFHLSRNILVQGVQFNDSPFWVCHFAGCESVTARNLLFNCYLVNNDGIDVESCRNVLIENNRFGNGDDCIAIKSGMDVQGREGLDLQGTDLAHAPTPAVQDGIYRMSTSRVVIRNNDFKSHYAIAIGSDFSAGAHDIYILDNRATQDVAMLFHIKSSRRRGSFVRDVYLDNFDASEVSGDVININLNYDNDPEAIHPTEVHNIEFTNIQVGKAHRGIVVEAWPDLPAREVSIRNLCCASLAEAPLTVCNIEKLKLENVVIAGIDYSGTINRINPDFIPSHIGNAAVKVGDKTYH